MIWAKKKILITATALAHVFLCDAKKVQLAEHVVGISDFHFQILDRESICPLHPLE